LPASRLQLALSLHTQIRLKLKQLTLSNKAVSAREHKREMSGGKVETTWCVKLAALGLCNRAVRVFSHTSALRCWLCSVS